MHYLLLLIASHDPEDNGRSATVDIFLVDSPLLEVIEPLVDLDPLEARGSRCRSTDARIAILTMRIVQLSYVLYLLRRLIQPHKLV